MKQDPKKNVGQSNLRKVYLPAEDVLDDYQGEQMGWVKFHGNGGASCPSGDIVTSIENLFENTGEIPSLSQLTAHTRCLF